VNSVQIKPNRQSTFVVFTAEKKSREIYKKNSAQLTVVTKKEIH
jgi:hypothetical protein